MNFTRLELSAEKYMQKGNGTFTQYVQVTSDQPCLVFVTMTQKMDGFTSLPVTSWGSRYAVVTHCERARGLCQIVVVANQQAKVVIQLPAQDKTSVSWTNTLNPAAKEDLTLTLNAYEIYQLQRGYDLTGATITSDVPIGVLSGSARSTVGPRHAGGGVHGATSAHSSARY
ncbi:uncharacterized protein LOC131933060 [Physella acuta]|uniref:uncharacterized protein LOC131933060 n=1 Tax=Physella acuta TaxID=109671 RepID=UPI0027DB1AEC|nr:uncharacterized protein LOC131933060 [Physella acuta]